MAIRACESVSEGLLGHFHPLAVASHLSDDRVFHQVARMVLLDLQYPVIGEDVSPRMKKTIAWFRDSHCQAVFKFVEEKGVDTKNLLQPSVQSGKEILSYCPRCLCEYTVYEGKCSDCAGINLIKFEGN